MSSQFESDFRARSGYTLPVFACASAIAALHCLQGEEVGDSVSLDLIEPDGMVEVAIEQVAKLDRHKALAITRSDPGDNLDLTRHTPVWAVVESQAGEWENKGDPSKDLSDGDRQGERIEIRGGEGIGRQSDRGGEAAIYRYARQLIKTNLQRLLKPHERVIVTIILPQGRRLASRTSNAAFGVVEGLSLLGTTGISQPLSAPSQLEAYREELAAKAGKFDCFVFCIGENGLDLARRMGIDPKQLLKTANWLGPLLVEAAFQGVQAILLFGYHGKAIKLAGGIFHTHHHLADGRLEILTAHCARLGLPTEILKKIFTSPTTEAALQLLRELDRQEGSAWVEKVYGAIAETIDRRCQDYIRKHTEQTIQIGSVLFDGDRSMLVQSQRGKALLDSVIQK